MILKSISSKIKNVAFLTLFISLISATSWSATYYVSTSGNDSNPGSMSAPWKTIGKVNSSNFSPGDNILFKRGETWNDMLKIPSHGSAGKPITFGAYGTGEKPTIDGTGTGKDYCIYWNKHYIIVDGLHLTNGFKTGICQYNASADYGIVRNCLIDYNERQGLYAGGSAVNNAENWIVENNTFAHNGGTRAGFEHGMYIKWAKGWVIQNNRFIRNNAYAMDINGSSNNIIRYNYSEGHVARGFMELYQDTAGGSKNNQIYYNISNGDNIFIYQGGGNDHAGNVINNNTVYNFSQVAISVDGGDLKELKNNIFWSSNPIARKNYTFNPGWSVLDSSNNILGPLPFYYKGTSYDSISNFKKAFPALEKDSVGSNPLFVNPGIDFHLAENSPGQKAGTPLSLTRDYEGTPLPNPGNPNIGAYESQKNSAITAPKNLRLIQ